MPKRSDASRRARDEAETLAASVCCRDILEMGRDRDDRKRLLSLMLALKRIELGDLPGDYLAFGRSLVADADNNCRWQALIVIGESLESDPDSVWAVVEEFGDSPDDDMRTGVACILLEHLLDADFDEYFPRTRDLIRRGRTRFADCLSTCWCDELSGQNYRRVQRLVRNTKRGVRAR
jgi:hypothetical protein